MFDIRNSQNFLQSNKTVKKILTLSNINKNDTVYEIGCGKGIITKQLAEKCNKVIGIELDNKLYNDLKIKFEKFDNIKIIEANFLDVNLPSYPYKVFSNIPFNITTQIIQKLTNIKCCPRDCYLKIMYEFQKLDFKPVPNVAVVLLNIKLKDKFLVDRKYYNKYQDFIIYVFSQNCVIRNAFSGIFSYEQIKRLGRTYEFNINDNINSINQDCWIELFKFFITNVSKNKQSIIANKFKKLKKQKEKNYRKMR